LLASELIFPLPDEAPRGCPFLHSLKTVFLFFFPSVVYSPLLPWHFYSGRKWKRLSILFLQRVPPPPRILLTHGKGSFWHPFPSSAQMRLLPSLFSPQHGFPPLCGPFMLLRRVPSELLRAPDACSEEPGLSGCYESLFFEKAPFPISFFVQRRCIKHLSGVFPAQPALFLFSSCSFYASLHMQDRGRDDFFSDRFPLVAMFYLFSPFPSPGEVLYKKEPSNKKRRLSPAGNTLLLLLHPVNALLPPCGGGDSRGLTSFFLCSESPEWLLVLITFALSFI